MVAVDGRRRYGERGQAIVELAGVLVIVALIVSALATTGLAGQVAGGISHSVSCILGSCSSNAPRVASAPPSAGGSGQGSAAGSGGTAGSGIAAGSGGTAGSGSAAGSGSTAGSGSAGAPGDGATNRGPQDARLPSGGDRPYVPPKGAHGKPQPVRGGGFEDAKGNKWTWDPSGHAGPHWDVTHPDGSRSHTNVSPEGKVIGGPGKDNFPNKAPKGSGDGGSSAGDTAKKAAGGAAIVGGAGGLAWWLGKLASPACGPAAPLCAVVL